MLNSPLDQSEQVVERAVALQPEERNRHFRTEHLTADIHGRSVRGGLVTLGAQAIKFVLQLGSTMILARLLTPADYGLIAMVTIVTGFVAMFKDAGLSMATIQRFEVNHEQVSTLFWVNVVISACLMIVVAALSPLIAWFYGDPRLTAITLALSVTLVLGGLTVQHQALLRRQMRFLTLAIIEILSQLTGMAVGIGLAYGGAGYWSLVAMSFGYVLANTILVWLLHKWRPGLPVRGSGVRSMLAFGGHLTGFNFINYFARNADNFLIGWWCGATQLGMYAKAYQLLMLPITQLNAPLSAVVVPALSRLTDKPAEYRRYYGNAVELMASVGMPLVCFCGAMAHELVVVFLGEQWLAAVPIFQALIPVAFIGTVNVAPGWVYVSLGNTSRQMKWSLISTPIVLVGIIVGLSAGAFGVAVGCSVAFSVTWLFGIPYCFRFTVIKVKDFLRAIWPPCAASIGAGIGTSVIVPFGEAAIRLAYGVPLFGLLYLALWLLLPGGTNRLIRGKALVRDLLPKKRIYGRVG